MGGNYTIHAQHNFITLMLKTLFEGSFIWEFSVTRLHLTS